jgi:predicted nucleic acid-binding protein
MMEPKKLQMSINPIKAPEAYQLVKRWEKEGSGEKGYENKKKIQEVLTAWSNLMELHGITDTMKLAMLLARGVPTPISTNSREHTNVQTEENTISQTENIKEETDPHDQDYLAILASAQAKVKK